MKFTNKNYTSNSHTYPHLGGGLHRSLAPTLFTPPYSIDFLSLR